MQTQSMPQAGLMTTPNAGWQAADLPPVARFGGDPAATARGSALGLGMGVGSDGCLPGRGVGAAGAEKIIAPSQLRGFLLASLVEMT